MLWRIEGEGARGGLAKGRAGLASLSEGGRARAGAACSLPHSLAPSLRRWVSQSVSPPASSPRASEPQRAEPRTPAPPSAIVRLAAAEAGTGARAPEPAVRLGGGGARAELGWGARSCPRGDGPGGRGGAEASLSPAPRRPGPGARAPRPPHALGTPVAEGLEPGTRPACGERGGGGAGGAFKS